MTCPFGTMDWYCCLAAGHAGPHESHELPPDTSTNPPSVPSLDVEACVRLLDDLILMLAPHDAQSIADANQLRALKAALPGMGKDSERIDWFEVNAFNAGFHDGACEVLDADGNEWRAKTFREAVDRAAQSQETSADG